MRSLESDVAFLIPSSNRKYRSVQYASLYFVRLMRMRPAVARRVQLTWPGLPVCGVADITQGQECVVIGTIYKHMRLKPSILDEYSRIRSATPLVEPTSLVSDDDSLALEDEKGRMKLTGAAAAAEKYVTGIIVAVRGFEQNDGDFFVSQLLPPGFPPLGPSPPLSPLPSSSRYVVLLSGLNFGLPSAELLPRHLLLDLMTGYVESDEETSLSSRVARIVIAGNSCCSQQQMMTMMMTADKSTATTTNTAAASSASLKEGRIAVSHLKEFDLFLSQLLSSVEVDVMPGPSDPSNASLPQQPLHNCLLPSSSLFSSLLLATNPHSFQVNGVSFMGTSGQNVEDMRRFSHAPDDCLSHLHRCLQWSHLAPSAPDTLACHPFQEEDPFVLQSCPQVLFAGNQPAFASQMLKDDDGQQSVLAVSVPAFSEAAQVVLVDISSLDCFCISLSPTVAK